MKNKFYNTINLLILLLLSINSNAQWSVLGGTNALPDCLTVNDIHSDVSGNIYATVETNTSGGSYIAKWNGSSWVKMGNSIQPRRICSDAAGTIYATGGSNSSGKGYVAKWDGTSWSEVGGLNALAANSTINAICTDASGNLYAAGNFKNSNSKWYVAKWDGTMWTELGGMNALDANGQIFSLCTDANNNVYAAGIFRNANLKCYVAKYNGSAWSELGGNNALASSASIKSICTDPSGNIYAAGDYIAKFNGTAWGELGGAGFSGFGSMSWSICSDPSGNIYAAGFFKDTFLNNYVAKFNGTSWSELGGPNSFSYGQGVDFHAVESDPSGNMYVGGEDMIVSKFSTPTSINNIYKSNINASLYPNPFVNSLNIEVTENTEAQIFDITSRKISDLKLNKGINVIETSTLKAGIYYVNLPGINSFKILKEE